MIKRSLKNTKYEPSNTITIDSDSDFINYGFPGSGTTEDPYLIQRLNITASSGDLIAIHNTQVFFIIRTNYLYGLTGSQG